MGSLELVPYSGNLDEPKGNVCQYFYPQIDKLFLSRQNSFQTAPKSSVWNWGSCEEVQ